MRGRGEGSVYERPDGRWAAILEMTPPGAAHRVRKTIYGKSKAEALRKLGEARRDYEEMGALPTADMTVERWLNYWLDEIAPQRVQPTTLPGYRSKIRTHVLPAIGRHRLDQLRPEHLRALYRDMEAAGKSRNTRQQTHAILSRALKVAVREGRVKRNVATLIDPPGAEKKKMPTLTSEEITTVLLHVRGMRMESRWLAALALGLRQGECLGLTWRHVDLDQGTLTVAQALARIDGRLDFKPPKSEMSTRTIPLPNDCLDSLRARRLDYEEERQAPGYDDHDLVWGQVKGRPMDARKDWQEWVDLTEAAGVKKVRLHDARHSAATTLVLLGVPLPVIAAILGHAEISTTMRYVHTDLSAMQAAMDLLNASRRREIEG